MDIRLQRELILAASEIGDYADRVHRRAMAELNHPFFAAARTVHDMRTLSCVQHAAARVNDRDGTDIEYIERLIGLVDDWADGGSHPKGSPAWACTICNSATIAAIMLEEAARG